MAHHRLRCKMLKHRRLISEQGMLPASTDSTQANKFAGLQGNTCTCTQHFRLPSFSLFLFCLTYGEENRHKDSTPDLHLVTDIWSREDNRLDHMTPARRGGWGVEVRERDELWQLSVRGSDAQANRDKEQFLPPEVMNHSGIQTL